MTAEAFSRIATRVLLGALFIVCVYRAITQSITFDEALTWQLYILAPVKNIFQHFDANHHFLNTVLMKLSTSIFGVSEWSLRLPALGGAALYFTAVDRLSRTAFGESLMSLLAVALLTLNPFVLDFMVAARGYGLGLALWMWGLALVYEAFSKSKFSARTMAIAGSAIALSVTANLVFAPPAAALAGMCLYMLMKRPKPEAVPAKKKSAPPPPRREWLWFAGPIGAIALAFLLLAPIENMKPELLYVGSATIVESLRSMASVSLAHSGPLKQQPWINGWRDAVAFGIAPLILAGGLAAGYLRRDLLLLLAAGSIAISALALLIIHIVLDRPYPSDRTGIYFLPLVALLLVGLANRYKIVSVLAILLVLEFATEFNTRKFLVWEYDADTRSIGESIAHSRPQNASLVRIGGSWHLQEALVFYGYQNHWDWMELTNETPRPGLDYYAFVPWEADAVGRMGLKQIYRGPVSGSVLAGPR